MRTLRMLSIAMAAATLAGCSKDSAKTADTLAVAGDTAAPSATAGPADTGVAPTASTGATTGMIDPNSASAVTLAAIPGVTAEIATAVVTARPYSSMVAVDKILAKSLSEQQRDSVYTRLWIPIDLNTATGEEILLIPGVGPRMRREFEEYRPYTSMAQFRREIGKYVANNELARLERYVIIR